MHYSYHNRIAQRIKNNELVDYYHTENYPKIGIALVLCFNTAPYQRPIRPHKWEQYKTAIQGVKK